MEWESSNVEEHLKIGEWRHSRPLLYVMEVYSNKHESFQLNEVFALKLRSLCHAEAGS